MKKIKEFIKKFRDILLLPIKRLRREKLKNKSFSIISNNCWGGIVYQYFNLPYQSPTVGMYFFAEEYIKFLSRLPYYMDCELSFRKLEDSKYWKAIDATGTKPLLGVLDDVEIVLLHYHSETEAAEKWNRRKNRIDWDHLLIKFNDQNLCTYEMLQKFDEMNYMNKVCFTAHEYPELNCNVWFKADEDKEYVSNDVKDYLKYVDVISLINQMK